MKPVIKSVEGKSNPVLGPEDGVPNYVMLWVQHPPGRIESRSTFIRGSTKRTSSRARVWCGWKVRSIRSRRGTLFWFLLDVEHQFRNKGAGTLSRVTVNPLSSVGKE